MKVSTMTRTTENHQNITTGNITIIGFAKNVPLKNKLYAFVVGSALSFNGYNIVAGNIIGTFSYAFWAAKIFGGKTLAMIDKDSTEQPFFIDRLLYTPSIMKKHRQVALLSRAAIIIGGGHGSLHLAKEFIKQGKPIVAISNTHGIVDGEVNALGVRRKGLFDAVHYLLGLLSLMDKKKHTKMQRS